MMIRFVPIIAGTAIAYVSMSPSFTTKAAAETAGGLGSEVAITRHLQDGTEGALGTKALIKAGERIFTAKWTVQEGGGRPFSKGNGAPLVDSTSPLSFPRNFNRISGPDANSCAGCHNDPVLGAGGDRATSVFVLGQRFDFATFDATDATPGRGARNEAGRLETLEQFGNERKTVGLSGSGYIEMLSRQMSTELRAVRDTIAPGKSVQLSTKGIEFGVLARRTDGTWDTSRVTGLPAPSLASTGGSAPPSLLILPFFQSGANVSIRQFTVSAFNHHHGIQPAERAGTGQDPDHDGFVNELTRADVTAVSVFQATLAVPKQVMPEDKKAREYVRLGESKFAAVGCAGCHTPALPLTNGGWVYSEPNPFNPRGNLQVGELPAVNVDLTSDELPRPRLRASSDGIVWVPAYTDMKLHDISSGPNDPGNERLDQNQPAGSEKFFAGNSRFLTARLWGVGNSGPYMHHGKFVTMREAIEAHDGEAKASRESFERLADSDRDAIIEFLKSMQVVYRKL